MSGKYSMDFPVPSYMVDSHYLLRPSAFMELAQEMAMYGSLSSGFGDDVLAKNNCVWILARMHVRFLKEVRRCDNVRMSTWHKGLQGVSFIRDYSLEDASGEAAVVSTSSWIVMNMETRRAVRSDQLGGVIPLEPQCTDSAIDEAAPKLLMPQGLVPEKAGEKRICYSDVDYNHHANNTKYVVWSMDCLPDELVYGSRLKEICINFIKEARPGETVELYRLEADGAWYVEGRIGDRPIFLIKMIFGQL